VFLRTEVVDFRFKPAKDGLNQFVSIGRILMIIHVGK
jgi:hypothetical protein